jgi:glycosyltransferase involved in cell wall biosynthesis
VRGYKRDIWKYTLVWLRGCIPVLRELQCDVAVLEGNFGILSQAVVAVWAKMTGRKVIFWVAGWQKPWVTGNAAAIREAFMRLVMRFGDYFVCYSTAAARWLERLGATPASVVVAQNTIDTETIVAARARVLSEASRLREQLALCGKPLMVYVGAITADKHTTRLVDLHRALRAKGIDVHTIIVGDGPAANELRAAAAHESGVHILGRIIDAVDPYFALGDVFVLPSIGGLAINQAMANGLPVVCGPADGTGTDLVADGVNGYYREHYDCNEWAALIAGILTDQALRERMARASDERVLRVASLDGMCRGFATAILRSAGRA